MSIDENELPPARASDAIKLETPVTTAIRQRPLPDAVARYEEWLKEIIPVAQEFAGHQSVSVIRPHAAGDAYTIVLHFDNLFNLRKWLDSDVRERLVDKIRPFLSLTLAIFEGDFCSEYAEKWSFQNFLPVMARARTV